MDKDGFKNLVKCIIWGIIWTGVAAVLALVIGKNSGYTYLDRLFVEGIALIIIGFFSTIGGDPMSLANLSSSGLNSSSMQYANLEVTKRERQINKDKIKRTISFGISSVAFIFAGLCCTVATFIF